MCRTKTAIMHTPASSYVTNKSCLAFERAYVQPPGKVLETFSLFDVGAAYSGPSSICGSWRFQE